ncbi:hypothetical protein EOD40_13680 [Flavobacterium sufflavum]|uniref:Uncharacterized protein n=1 Tax=Flavobacterium sufflavum TaxID=1921138 RepID=A0A3S2V2F1_9FLAO|nr:hypothetical protein [Flavobacterium sufflavum]RVT73964.1 hypothetical protein EOD40_13680 [Flavobacterium sufflavum]
MEQFKIRKDGFKEIRKSSLNKAIPISLIALFGGLSISYFNADEQQDVINIFPFLIPLMLGLLAFGLYRGINRQKEIFESYVITFNNNDIIREQYNTSTITISKTDIDKIIKNSNGSFTIKGNSIVDVIDIPSQIENYEKIEKSLSEIRQISTKNNEPFFQKYRLVLSIFSIGLMACVYISKDKIIVGVSGTILLVLLGYSFFEIQRNKSIDKKTKKGMWWLIVVIASIIGNIYFKIMGQ